MEVTLRVRDQGKAACVPSKLEANDCPYKPLAGQGKSITAKLFRRCTQKLQGELAAYHALYGVN